MKRKTTAIVVFLLTLAACGASRQVVVTRTVLGLDAAFNVWKIQDKRAEDTIVDAALSKEEGRGRLAEHRVKADKVYLAFELAYAAAAAALLAPDDLRVARLIQLAAAAYDAWQAATAPPAEAGGAS